ncbi:MAG: hypothetical protein QN174_09085 [Armatimonadota bacterium]|nr:hypothetical protein [Armatimonadota bacterium]MDR7453240.1 hypothetical protein [Armatimonadota bacterium]MDR7455856.1 hypothetical protein [Armatimonadota bacterium]MDR7497097.1 hypothetical protein [Armatimonadota bacterium]MDR7511913.1 hypothetical protein [Armatimonadota bacterium]
MGIDLRRARGAALMDVVVGLTVMALAAGGIFAGLKGSMRAWITAQQFAGEQHNARLVLDWTARRLRAAGSGFEGVPLLRAEGADVVFAGDTDGNGVIECHRIYLNTTEAVVYASRIEPIPADTSLCGSAVGDPLTANVEVRNLTVTGLSLRYFDDSPGAGAPLAAAALADPLVRSSVRRIQITIQARGLESPGTLGMSTDVYLRR